MNHPFSSIPDYNVCFQISVFPYSSYFSFKRLQLHRIKYTVYGCILFQRELGSREILAKGWNDFIYYSDAVQTANPLNLLKCMVDKTWQLFFFFFISVLDFFCISRSWCYACRIAILEGISNADHAPFGMPVGHHLWV